ncbi:unnamed protein product [Pleuronectes platessa]|uniref:Uncharacterized protein n=1 Tax=Pleuronectes platessa TaxID=8262 RepID=A0A9N7VFN2_PLEPL|nr:unnamed protein product [Pleuronectes platessa]
MARERRGQRRERGVGVCASAILVRDTAVLVDVVKSSSRTLPRAKRGSCHCVAAVALTPPQDSLGVLSGPRSWSLSSAETTDQAAETSDENRDDYTRTTCYGGASA